VGTLTTPPLRAATGTLDRAVPVTRRRTTASERLRRLRTRPRLAALAVVGATAAVAGVVVWQMPRGPVTTPDAVAVLVAAVALGGMAGLVVRSRWSTWLAPLTWVVVHEAAWLAVDGPMTDAPPLGSLIGWLVLVLGRGWLGLLVLVPMVVGAALGRSVARRLAPDAATSPRPGLPARVGTGLGVVVVLALLAGLLRPVGTPPITDADGEVVAGSIAELTTVELGGHEVDLLLRGRDATAPVVLYAAGGPGGSDVGAMRLFGGPLEDLAVVATWEQRGTGKAYDQLDPKATLTLQQSVEDLIALADHLRDRFDRGRVVVLGNSWGSTLAVLAAQQAPDRFDAIVGVGQMVSQRATDVLMYEQLVADAASAGDTDRMADLAALGPPPYEDVGDYAPLLVRSTDDGASTEWPANTLVSEYSLVEQVNVMPALVEVFATLYPQLQDVDFRRDVTTLDVPVWVVDGEHEDPARSTLSAEWLAALDAPRTEHVVIPDAGHRPHLQNPEAVADVMARVLATVDPRR
jgi:proline iminopeptidase